MDEGDYLDVTSALTKNTYTSNATISLSNTNSQKWLIRLRSGDNVIAHTSGYSGSLTGYLLDKKGDITNIVNGGTGYSSSITVSGAVYVYLIYSAATRGNITITIKP